MSATVNRLRGKDDFWCKHGGCKKCEIAELEREIDGLEYDLTPLYVRLDELRPSKPEPDWKGISARLAEALGENYGRPKACGHDFDCLCVGDKSLRVLADYAAATKERT